jgi:hypothetical protein
MNEPRIVELWPCGYTARCSAPECRRRATTILRYLDSQERADHQADACDTHASELLRCAESDRPQALNARSRKARMKLGFGHLIAN